MKVYQNFKEILGRVLYETKQQEDFTKYKKERNLVVKLKKEMKLQYYNNSERFEIFLR